jgi:2-polyprenyl-6-methoxyphenol hydroxylase-like FAD-dependent oxidoreductase
MTLERVVIVGGGVAGLTLALALKQAGVDVEVHEKYDHLQGRTTGFTIWSYAIQQLVSIGMEEEALDRIGSEIEVTEVRLQDGTLIGEMPVGEASRDLGAPSYDIGRRDLQEQLIAAIGADSVHMRSECVGVEQGDGPATILLADGDRASGDLVVAADGIHSVLRDTVARKSRLRYSGFGGWSGLIDFEHELLEPGHHVEMWGHGSKAGVASAGPGRARWYATERAPAGKNGVRRDEIFEHVDGWYRLVRDAVLATDEAQIVRAEAWDLDPLSTWVKGRVVLVGDAAHATTPFAAMGACMAIDDALSLRDALETNEVEDALVAYQDHRKKQAEKMVRHGRRMGHLAQVHNPFLAHLRDSFFEHIPPDKFKELAADMAAGR